MSLICWLRGDHTWKQTYRGVICIRCRKYVRHW